MTLTKPALLRDIFDEIVVTFFNEAPRYSFKQIVDEIKPTMGSIPSYPVSSYAINEAKSSKLEVALTGFKEDEISIMLQNDVLNIKASKEKQSEKKDEEAWKYIYQHVATRDIDISFKLSPSMDLENISTKYENGLLTVFFPVKIDQKNYRKLTINSITD